MITLLHQIINPEPVDISEVSNYLDNIQIFFNNIKTSIKYKNIDFQLTKWYKILAEEDNYLAIFIMVDLDNPLNYQMRIKHGTYEDSKDFYDEPGIYEDDLFIDIKNIREININQLISDIISGEIPLWNRDKNINYEKYNYIDNSN